MNRDLITTALSTVRPAALSPESGPGYGVGELADLAELPLELLEQIVGKPMAEAIRKPAGYLPVTFKIASVDAGGAITKLTKEQPHA